MTGRASDAATARQADRIRRQVMSNQEADEVASTYEGMIAALDSLETILFGDCFRRSRDELEARAEELVSRV